MVMNKFSTYAACSLYLHLVNNDALLRYDLHRLRFLFKARRICRGQYLDFFQWTRVNSLHWHKKLYGINNWLEWWGYPAVK